MDGKEFAQALLAAIKRRKGRRIQRAWDEDAFGELIEDALNPKPAEENLIPASTLPVVRPEFPQLRVKYGPSPAEFGRQLSKLSGEAAMKFLQGSGQAAGPSEWVILNKIDEVAPFATWVVEPMKSLERLKAENVPEFTPPQKAAGVL
jgi:hypothetical protein